MENQILSLDVGVLKKFIDQSHTKPESLIVKYRVDLEHYQYNMIVNKLSEKLEFIEVRYISFVNGDMVINFYFENDAVIDIIDEYVSSNIKYENLIENKDIRSEIIISHVLVKDLCFDVFILEKTSNDKLIEKTRYTYSFQQIMRCHIGKYYFDIVITNNDQYHIEFIVPYKGLDDSIKQVLNTILDLLYGRNIIIDNNLYLSKYKAITRSEKSTLMQIKSPHNMMITDLLDIIDNTYAVFDKTDGERVHLMFFNNRFVYFNSVFNCYHVANGTSDDIFILDCERYKNRFYVFDLVYSSIIEQIDTMSLYEKLEHARELLDQSTSDRETFIVKTPVSYDLKDTKETFFGKVVNLYREIEQSDIENDGMIFQSVLSNKVMRDKKIFDYRWKPKEKATVDCFIKFEGESYIRTLDKTFIKITLYCYAENTTTKKEELKFFDFSYTEVEPNGLIFTKVGEILISDIVVEFEPDFIDMQAMIQNTNTYTNTFDENDPNLNVLNSASLFSDRGYNWIPLRIRYDKTFAVTKYQRKHGNNVTVADQIKEYIDRPILFDYFVLLAENFQDAYLTIQKTIMDKKVKSVAKSFDKFVFDYVQTVTLLSWAFMLSQIAPYKPIIVELDCRKANNVYKIYSYGVVFTKFGPVYDGYNTNNIELLSNIDGAISRYNDAKTKKPNFFEFRYHFIKSIDSMFEIQSKFNTLFGFEFYRYQYSDSIVKTMKKIFDKILFKDSYIFLVMADLKDNTESNSFITGNRIEDFIIKVPVDKVLSIIDYKVLENKSFKDYFDDLLPYQSDLKNMTNKRTTQFIYNAIGGFDKSNQEIYKSLRFVILRK